MKTTDKIIEDNLMYTFAWDLLGESGSPKEGKEELVKAIHKIIGEVGLIPMPTYDVFKCDPNAKG